MGLRERINGLFSRNDKGTATINESVNQSWGGWQWFNAPRVGKYSDVYFYSIINKIFNGLDNSRFTNNGEAFEVDEIATFLNDNAKHIIWNYWRDGYVVIDYTDEYFVWDAAIQKDAMGQVMIPSNREWFVVYSDTYILKRKSHFGIVKNELDFLDRLGNSLDYLTSTYGSVGIITGKTMPMNATDKEELNEQLKNNLGITRDRQQFIISRGTDFDIKQFSFDMAGLDLGGKIKDQYLLLADFFNVPKNILTTDTDSTYENQNAALKRFYTDCISPICEVILAVGRGLVTRLDVLQPSTDLSFTFDNVEVLNNDEAFLATVERLTEVIGKTDDEAAKSALKAILQRKIEKYQ